VFSRVSKFVGFCLCWISPGTNPRDGRVSVVWRTHRSVASDNLRGVSPAEGVVCDPDVNPDSASNLCHVVSRDSHTGGDQNESAKNLRR
jgi:hypothetical protein